MFSNIKSKLNAAASAAATSITETAVAQSNHAQGQDRDDLDRATREQLLAECKQNRAQLARYKQRLSDVVQAYKGLQKENQALETSLHAINPAAEGQSVEGGEVTDGDRVGALTAALATLTQEKNALQAGFVEDKRRMVQQHKDAIQAKDEELRSLREELSAGKTASVLTVTNSPRARADTGQWERERRQLTDDLAAARMEVDVLKNRIGGLGALADFESLHKALDQERDRANKLEMELGTLQTNFQAQRHEHAEELHRVETELREMSELYAEVEAARAAAGGRADEVRLAAADENDALRRSLADTQGQVETLQAELREMQARMLTQIAQAEAGDGKAKDDATTVDRDAAVLAGAEELASKWRVELEGRVSAAEALTLDAQAETRVLQAALAEARAQAQQHIADLEEQISANRRRAVALLDDKEREIADLRVQLTRQANANANAAAAREASANDTETPASATSATPTSVSPEPLVHQVQLQIARDRELAQAVRARTALKEQLDTAELQIETQLHAIRELEEKIKEYQRTEKRENVSMEYFKNILLKYLAAPQNQQPHLARAICALLQLNPQETSLFLSKMKV